MREKCYPRVIDDTVLKTQEEILNIEEFSKTWLENYTETQSLLENLNLEARKTLFLTVRKFILMLLSEMKSRLPFQNAIIKSIQVVFLQNFDMSSWKSLANQFTNIIKPEEARHFQNELERMDIGFNRLSHNHLDSSRSILESWKILSKDYPFISRLANAVLTLPYSSVSVERIFSKMQDFKTPKRNRLSIENLEIYLLINQEDPKFSSFFDESMITIYRNMYKQNTNANTNTITTKKEDLSIEPDKKDEINPPKQQSEDNELQSELVLKALKSLITNLFVKPSESQTDNLEREVEKEEKMKIKQSNNEEYFEIGITKDDDRGALDAKYESRKEEDKSLTARILEKNPEMESITNSLSVKDKESIKPIVAEKGGNPVLSSRRKNNAKEPSNKNSNRSKTRKDSKAAKSVDQSQEDTTKNLSDIKQNRVEKRQTRSTIKQNNNNKYKEEEEEEEVLLEHLYKASEEKPRYTKKRKSESEIQQTKLKQTRKTD